MLHLWICLVNCFEVADGTSGSCQHLGTWLSRPLWLWSKSAADVPSWDDVTLIESIESSWKVVRPVAPSWLIKEVLHCPEFGQVCPLWYRCCALRFLTYIRVVRLAKTKCFGFPGPDAHRHWTSTSRLTWSQYVDRASKLWNFCLKLTYGFPSFPVIFSHSHNFSYMFLSFHFFEWQWRETRKPMKIRKENLTLNTS